MFYIGDSEIQGKGVFIDQDVPKGICLGLAHTLEGNKLTRITKLGKFHNHSVFPNCKSFKIGNNRYLFSLRDLVKGEEITVDYRKQPELEQPKENWDMARLLLLDHNGQPQMKLGGREIVFSRVSTKKILDLAEKASDGDNRDILALGKFVYQERMKQKKRDKEI